MKYEGELKSFDTTDLVEGMKYEGELQSFDTLIVFCTATLRMSKNNATQWQ